MEDILKISRTHLKRVYARQIFRGQIQPNEITLDMVQEIVQPKFQSANKVFFKARFIDGKKVLWKDILIKSN